MRLIRQTLLPAALLLALLTGCDGTKEGSPGDNASGGAAAKDSATALPGYSVVEVRDGGTIRGKVKLAGEAPKLDTFTITADKFVCGSASRNNRLQVGEGGGVAYAVVYLEGVRSGKPMPELPPEAFTMDQKGCQYIPHVVAAPVGGKVSFTNSDDAPHNVRVEKSDSMLMNVAQPNRGLRDDMPVTHAGPMSVGCDYHPWMNAYVFGVDNPYYAVTGSDGSFTIDAIPPGSYTVKMWFNGIGTTPRKDNQGRIIRYAFADPYQQEKKVELAANGSTELTFEIAP